MRIVIQTTDHAKQRYPTTGDWKFEDETFYVTVSKLGDWRYEALVAIHEVIEAVLCKHAGITDEAVTAFDVEFEAARQHFTVRTPPGQETEFKFRGKWVPMSREPGDHFGAPYYQPHQIATGIERILAERLDVDWSAYERANLDAAVPEAI